MSKIQLSAEEMQLVVNRDWILTKHRIIEKVYQLFGNLSAQMQLYLEQVKPLPAEVMQVPAKISKGEQYEALPYVVLDYPRYFAKEDVLALRSFFWWGNYFSITLHLKGKYYRKNFEKIATALAENKLKDYFFSFAGNEFSFDLEGKNYCKGNGNAGWQQQLEQHSFLKISYKISFEHWDTAEEKLLHVFKQLISIIED